MMLITGPKFLPARFSYRPELANTVVDEIAAISNAITTANQFGSLVPARFDVPHNLVELYLIHLRTLFGLGNRRVAYCAFPRTSAALFNELIVDFLFHEHAGTGAAALAWLKNNPSARPPRLIQIGVREHDVGLLPPSSRVMRFKLDSRQPP